jgi:hypothetical protein
VANYGASNVEAITGLEIVENLDTRVRIRVIFLQSIPGRRTWARELITGQRTKIQRQIIEGTSQDMDCERIRDPRLV